MLAIIPARGGSKGLPNKNIRLFCGKPLIAYTIEAALNSESISRVIVSTDSQEIADISKCYGAEVPFLRPAHLSTDTSSQYDAVVHLICELKKGDNFSDEDIIILQPTSPLRTSRHIDEAIETYLKSGAPALISVTALAHPVEWVKDIDENGHLTSMLDIVLPLNRQAYSERYMPNGLIYIYRINEILSQGGFDVSPIMPYVVNKKYSDDIDDLLDFQIAEMKYKMIYEVSYE